MLDHVSGGSWPRSSASHPPAIALWETGARAFPGPVEKLIELYEAELNMDGSRDKPSQRPPRRSTQIATDVGYAEENAKLSRTLAGATTQLAGARASRAILKARRTPSEIFAARRRSPWPSKLVESLGRAQRLGP